MEMADRTTNWTLEFRTNIEIENIDADKYKLHLHCMTRGKNPQSSSRFVALCFEEGVSRNTAYELCLLCC